MNKRDTRKPTRRRRRGALILTQPTPKAKIRVQLDARTVITLPHMSSLKLWKDRYPDAKILSQ
ncbi:MAG TPA: hypothetical protein VI757_09280 [Bacteroidia bacterium]|nr:hypothetical protein [Bacteroidia bacterium]